MTTTAGTPPSSGAWPPRPRWRAGSPVSRTTGSGRLSSSPSPSSAASCRSTYDKIRGKKYPSWDWRRWKRTLERECLGTIRHLSLGEYGINHFDDTLIVFTSETLLDRRLLESFLPLVSSFRMATTRQVSERRIFA